MIPGTNLFCDHMAFILFYLGSTFSFICMKFALGWDLDCEFLDIFVGFFIYLSSLSGVSMRFMRYKTFADFVIKV